MEHWEDNHFTVNWEKLPSEIRMGGEWNEIKSHNFSKVEYLIIWHHKTKDKTFENLPDAPNLKYLEVNWSGSTSLKGLEKYKNLKRLELHYCTKIESISDICKLKDHIRYIHINMSKKINDHSKIVCCSNLTTLCFNECGKIENLLFLSKLKQLRDFRFVNTNILSGNLTPLIEHPRINNAGFLNKRHYSHKHTEIDKLLSGKSF